MTDPEILRKARTEGRILLTHDLDFADLVAASGSALPSVVIFRLHRLFTICGIGKRHLLEAANLTNCFEESHRVVIIRNNK